MDLILILLGLAVVLGGAMGDDAPPPPAEAPPPLVAPEPAMPPPAPGGEAAPAAEPAPPPASEPAPEAQPEPAPEPETRPDPAPETPDRRAEDQTPTGQFTTAAEVRPILDATRGNWVALRAYNGQDLLYFTHLLTWRCGLFDIGYGVNDGPVRILTAEPCHTDTAMPNALKADAILPYVALDPGSVQSVTIELLYDDLSTDGARFERGQILLP